MMNRVLRLSFLGLTMLQRIRGELLYEDALEARDMKFGSPENGVMRIDPKGSLNLLLGFLAHKLGLDYNIRMYFEEIDPKFKNDKGEYERCWRDDKGVGELGSVFVDLFPSHGGSLSVSSNGDTSFYTSLTKGEKGRDKGVKFLAALMVYSLGGKLEYKKNVSGRNSFVSIGDFKIEKLKKEAGERIIRIIEYLRKPDPVTEEEMPIIEKFVKSKRFPLLSFVFMFLDNRKEMEDFLNTFFSIADEGVREKCFIAEKDYKDETDYGLLSDVVEKMKLFPFSELSPPPSNISVYGYSRSKNGGKGGFLNARVADCVEISILEFVCCVFFNSRTLTYPIDKLEKASPDLKNFFSTRESLFPFDIECRKDWFKVVQDRKDSQGKHDTRINYVRKYSETGSEAEPDKKYSEEDDPRARNEVEPGFLNLLSIFMSIWNPDDEDLQRYRFLEKRSKANEPKEKNEISNAIKEFEEVFRKVVSIISNNDEKKINIEYSGLKIGAGLGGEFWDIYGNIILTIGIENLFVAIINLKHDPGHAETTIIKTEFPGMLSLQKNSEIAGNLLSSKTELDHLIGKYVTGCVSPPDGNKVLELVKENIYNGFSHGCLNNDGLRFEMIKALYNYSKNLDQSSDAHRKIHGMISNIIANSTLDDREIAIFYGIFILTDEVFSKRFLGLLKLVDSDKTQILKTGLEYGADEQMTYNFLKDNLDAICCPEGIKTIANPIIALNREDLLEILKGAIGNYPESRIYGFVYAGHPFIYEDSAKLYSFVKHVFEKMDKADIIKFTPITGAEYKLPIIANKVLENILKDEGSIGKEDLEKIYCCCFYPYILEVNPLIGVLEKTFDSPNLPIDFIYDCMVRCPGLGAFKFYIKLLKLIIEKKRNGLKIRRDVFTTIKHMVEFVAEGKKKGKKFSFYDVSSEAPQETGELLRKIEEEKLIYEDEGIEFDEKKFKELIYTHLENIAADSKEESLRRNHRKYTDAIEKFLSVKQEQ